jgi:glycosyltransferase involved in cell wall biosynthesis
MKLSIIIPCYNAADTLGEQLEALVRQNWQGEWEVIVADNGSTDDSRAVAARYADRLPLRIVDASARRGAGFAYATGAAAATGDALLFCDADDVVGEGWLAAMAAALAVHDFVAAACDMEKLNEPWVRATRANTQKTGLQQYHYPPFLPHAGTSTLGVKRPCFEAVGGFDQSLYLPDTDLCWRLQLAGVQLHFVPEAVVHVRLRTSLRAIFRQALAWGEGNVALYRKYRPLGMPPLGRWAWIPGWWALIRGLTLWRTRGGRARWLWQFGWRLGRLRGSLRYRVWAL